MKTDQIIIANLKCDGCANTITSRLSEISGVEKVEVNKETDTVTVEHDENVNRNVITEKLASLGYPEATAENGLLMQIKSYASCVIGRVHI